jgi:hypothetical protein
MVFSPSRHLSLVGLKEFHMVKLVHGLKTHKILLQDWPTTKRNPHLLEMKFFCYNIKKKRVIQNEIMAFHRHPQPTVQNPHLYSKEMWKKMKLQHKYNKVLFMLLERTLNNDFFKGKICMNSSKDLPFDEFNEVFEEWISRSAKGNPHMGLVCLESHYRVDPLLELNNLKDVVDNSLRNVNFLNHELGKTFILFSTTKFLSKDLDICFLTNWKNVFQACCPQRLT